MGRRYLIREAAGLDDDDIQSQSASARMRMPRRIRVVDPIPCSFSGGHDPMMSFELPDDIMLAVFKRLDGNSLLKCRLVSSKWNNLIINTSNLMRQLTFDITGVTSTNDVNHLLQSTTVTKIRSIAFKEPLGSASACTDLERLMAKVGASVDKVVLQLEFPLLLRSHVFELLVSNCTNLQELSVRYGDDQTTGLRELTPSEIQIFGSKLRKLTLMVLSRKKPGNSVEGFLLSLPKLSAVHLVGIGNPQFLYCDEELTAVHRHLDRYPHSLQVFEMPICKVLLHHSIVNLISACKRNGTKMKLDKVTFLFDSIITNTDVELTPDSLEPVKRGEITLLANNFTSFGRVGFFTNITKLYVSFQRIPVATELEFVHSLDQLRKLRLINASEIEIGLGLLDLFGEGALKTIQSLTLDDVYFQPQSFPLLNLAFPNISKLKLSNQLYFPFDLFSFLAVLEQMEVLVLEHCSLSDDMVIHLTQNYWNLTAGPVPAIATFKCLKELHLVVCEGLTDISLVQGVACMQGLEYFSVDYFTGQFTDVGFNAIIQAGMLKTLIRNINTAVFVQAGNKVVPIIDN